MFYLSGKMAIKDETLKIVSQDPILFTKPLLNNALTICKRPGSTAILRAESVSAALWLHFERHDGLTRIGQITKPKFQFI